MPYHRFWKVITLFAIMLMVGILPTHAQSSLTYGAGAVGTLSPDAPIAVYTFQGQANDLVTLQVISLAPTLQTSLSLNSATNTQIATSSQTASDVATGITRLSVRLPDSGIYIVLLSSANGETGDYVIRLDGIATQSETTVNEGDISNNTTDTGTSFFVYFVTANEATPQLATFSASADSATYTIQALNPDGSQLGVFNGTGQNPVLITLPSAIGTYTLEVTINSTEVGDVNLSIAPLGAPPPVVTEDVQATDVAPTLAPTTAVQPTNVPTEANVQPTNVPTEANVQPTIAPTATSPQQTVQPTATSPQQTVQPTATFTSSYTPTMMATATFTPSYTPTEPAPQLAPEDARFNNPLAIPLDSTVSVLDFVSYPEGDSEDRVRFEVTGMNNNSALSGGRARLVIAATCFGDNTDQVQFFTGGQTYTCGQTLIDREVTADSDTGSIVITAIGGEGTYVQWVLTGTATRTN